MHAWIINSCDNAWIINSFYFEYEVRSDPTTKQLYQSDPIQSVYFCSEIRTNPIGFGSDLHTSNKHYMYGHIYYYLGSVRHRGHKFGSYFLNFLFYFVSSRARSRRSKSLRRRRQLPVNKCTSGKHRRKSVRIVDLKPEDVIILTYMFSWITILEYMLI